MSTLRLRTLGSLTVLAAIGALAAGCETSAEPDAAGSAPSSAAASPTVNLAANKKTVCEAGLQAVKAGFGGMADDAIAQIDKPVSKAEEDRKIREHYTTIVTGLKAQAPQAADPAVRTAFENLAGAIEQRMADKKPMEVDEPSLTKPIEAFDTACGN
ncbi:hypothetical protein E1211_06955 [Micromonospora sp. 15K316]|uniref:hypothetical protein n=1 Tax=Micromonospora sp. 15K316 TaxID=2530376 RepID=UPI00104891C2|nr:hypothetical protein [Micromonospora sp. 15K316]TDC38470.1 hypothetical protein E1211_06955 [Micromonospora sp. 15K316]